MSTYASPYKTPTKRMSKSDMSLSEISSPSKTGINSKHEQILEKIKVTKNEISVLVAKTDAYSKNTAKNYKDITTPTKKDNNDSYKKSPFGKELGISDYSHLV